MILLIVGVALLAKKNLTIKQLQKSIRDTAVIPNQGNLTQFFHLDGEQQLHVANGHPQQGSNDPTVTEKLACSAHTLFPDVKEDAIIYENAVFLPASFVSHSHSNTQQCAEEGGANCPKIKSHPACGVLQQQKHRVPPSASVISHSHPNKHQHAQQDGADGAWVTNHPPSLWYPSAAKQPLSPH